MSKRVAFIDVGIVVLACCLYVGMELLGVSKRWSFAVSGVLLLGFVSLVVFRRTDSWRDFGFRTDNLFPAGLPVLGGTFIIAIGVVVWAVAMDRPIRVVDILILGVLYPVWATIQQFVFQGVLHRRLMVVVPTAVGQVLITASAFAAVHVGNARLVVLTFLAGVVWSTVYRRWPNLWLLAISHTVLASVVYPVMLADAPLSRF